MERTFSLKICENFFEINVPYDSNGDTYSHFYVIAIYRCITLTSIFLTRLHKEENYMNKYYNFEYFIQYQIVKL